MSKNYDEYLEFKKAILILIAKDFPKVNLDNCVPWFYKIHYELSKSWNKIKKQNSRMGEKLLEKETKKLNEHFRIKEGELNKNIKLIDAIVLAEKEQKEWDEINKKDEEWK